MLLLIMKKKILRTSDYKISGLQRSGGSRAHGCEKEEAYAPRENEIAELLYLFRY